MTAKIFIFTAGNPDARQHLDDSIKTPIRDETVFANFLEADHQELAKVREEGHGLYAWGAVPGPTNRRTWEAMERDDHVRRWIDDYVSVLDEDIEAAKISEESTRNQSASCASKVAEPPAQRTRRFPSALVYRLV